MSYIDWFCPILETISPGAQVLCLGFIKEVVVGSDITTLARLQKTMTMSPPPGIDSTEPKDTLNFIEMLR